MRRSGGTVRVYEVLFHAEDERLAHSGPAGDGSFIERFRSRKDAEEFAQRWGLA